MKSTEAQQTFDAWQTWQLDCFRLLIQSGILWDLLPDEVKEGVLNGETPIDEVIPHLVEIVDETFEAVVKP